MARPKKFRLSIDEVLDPRNAERLAAFVGTVETLREEVVRLQEQIAETYDDADEAGYDKALIRKTVARRTKPAAEREAEEEAVETYSVAVERGFLSCVRVGNDETVDPETGEITSRPEGAGDVAPENTSQLIQPSPPEHTPPAKTSSAEREGDDSSATSSDDLGASEAILCSGGAEAARLAHNQEVVGASPTPATNSPETATSARASGKDAAFGGERAPRDEVSRGGENAPGADESGASVSNHEATDKPASSQGLAAPGVVRMERCPPAGVIRHDYQRCFPDRGAMPQLTLAKDIEADGVRRPIVKIGDHILDGWHRFLAARDLGIEYPVVEYAGQDALADVIRWNLTGDGIRDRRMMTMAERKTIATKLCKLPEVAHRSAEVFELFGLEERVAA